ncbi:unnamed protein product [Closterium sp. NIES-64]|nr:unnamed protein product [Closterium sp. NIES-64]
MALFRVYPSILALLAVLSMCHCGRVNGWYVPKPGTTFFWQLSGSDADVDPTHPAKVYTVDSSLTAKSIAKLRNAGKAVMCYISFGTAEDYRSDYNQFPKSVIGGLTCRNEQCTEVWPGERWLDIKSPIVKTIMEKRIKLAKSKGCDGVDPDNINAYSNNIMAQPISKFTITADDQFKYNSWIANTVHKYGMSVGLKNPGPLAPSFMANLFDWAIIESCIYFSDFSNNAWYSRKYACDYSNEFIVRNKAVFSIEYKELWGTSAGQVNGIAFPQAMCAISNAHGFNTNLCSFSLGTGPRYPFANCPLHKPAGCDTVWKECVKQSVYAQYKKQGMARWDAVGQCMRAKRAACKYKA